MDHSEKVLVMRIFITILILIFSFQSLTKAEDIRDFEIEGISIGDSLLDFFSQEEIENIFKEKYAVNYYPKSKDFFTLATIEVKSNTYSQINFDLKTGDGKFIIYSLDGFNQISYQECFKKRKEISSKIENLFIKEDYIIEPYKIKHRGDETGKSIVDGINYILNDGSAITIACYDFGKEMENKNYSDNISVNVSSSEFFYWIRNKAY